MILMITNYKSRMERVHDHFSVTAKKDLTDVTNQLDHNTGLLTNVTNSLPQTTASPTTTASSELVSAKERLTAGLDNSNRTCPDERNNNKNNSNHHHNSNIQGSLDRVAVNNNDNQSGTIPQKRSKGRRKKASSSVNVRANVNNAHKTAFREKENHQNPSARFSPGSGLFEGKR